MTFDDEIFVPISLWFHKKNLGSGSPPSPILAVGGFDQTANLPKSDWVDSHEPNFFGETYNTRVPTYYQIKSFGKVLLSVFYRVLSLEGFY